LQLLAPCLHRTCAMQVLGVLQVLRATNMLQAA
jgi:hypothetical protein